MLHEAPYRSGLQVEQESPANPSKHSHSPVVFAHLPFPLHVVFASHPESKTY